MSSCLSYLHVWFAHSTRRVAHKLGLSNYANSAFVECTCFDELPSVPAVSASCNATCVDTAASLACGEFASYHADVLPTAHPTSVYNISSILQAASCERVCRRRASACVANIESDACQALLSACYTTDARTVGAACYEPATPHPNTFNGRAPKKRPVCRAAAQTNITELCDATRNAETVHKVNFFVTVDANSPPLHLAIPASVYGSWASSPSQLCLSKSSDGVSPAVGAPCLLRNQTWLDDTINGQNGIIIVRFRRTKTKNLAQSTRTSLTLQLLTRPII